RELAARRERAARELLERDAAMCDASDKMKEQAARIRKLSALSKRRERRWRQRLEREGGVSSRLESLERAPDRLRDDLASRNMIIERLATAIEEQRRGGSDSVPVKGKSKMELPYAEM